MKQINETNYLSDECMVFRQKETGIIYGWGISLGLTDTLDNYEEVEDPDYNIIIQQIKTDIKLCK